MAAADDAERAELRRQAVELAKCSADAAYLTDTYGIIDNASGEDDDQAATVPFKLWPSQVRVSWELMRHKRVIVLKARQLGITWIVMAYALWLCLFRPGATVLIISKGQKESNENLRRIRVLFERLPDWFREWCPFAAKPTTEELSWLNGSRVMSSPASSDTGRTFTVTLAIMDEAAIPKNASQIYAAVKSTVDNGGQLVMLSTAKGIGNLFHRIWKKAEAGLNGFRAIFLPWWARPGHDQEWYDRARAEAEDTDLFTQENPASPREAFKVSGRPRFKAEWIEAQEPNVADPMQAEVLPDSLREIDGLIVWELPPAHEADDVFLISADVAEGLEDGDYSTFAVISARTWRQVASYHGHPEPDEFGKILAKVGRAYHNATVVVERNNHGHATLAALRAEAYPKIALGPDGRQGWVSDTKHKPQSVDALAGALRDGNIVIRNAADLDEIAIYQRLANGKTGAPDRYNDDRVMAWAIAIGFLTIIGIGESEARWETDPLAQIRW